MYMLYVNNEEYTHTHILFSQAVNKVEESDYHPNSAEHPAMVGTDEKKGSLNLGRQISSVLLTSDTMPSWRLSTPVLAAVPMHEEFASTSTCSPGTSLPGKESSEHISCLSHTPTTITAEIQKCKGKRLSSNLGNILAFAVHREH